MKKHDRILLEHTSSEVLYLCWGRALKINVMLHRQCWLSGLHYCDARAITECFGNTEQRVKPVRKPWRRPRFELWALLRAQSQVDRRAGACSGLWMENSVRNWLGYVPCQNFAWGSCWLIKMMKMDGSILSCLLDCCSPNPFATSPL